MSSEYREFQVFVKPVGARCNLACSYCYYLEKKDIVTPPPGLRMPDDVLELYIRQHIEASTEPEIFFSWHGGEPTLAGLDFYRKALKYQARYRPSGKTIVNGMQTNATAVTEEWGSFLREGRFHVGISLDGPERYHNINRISHHVKGSFTDVIRGLEIIRKNNVPHEFLCVVSDDNAHEPLEVYRYFKSLDATFITFLPLVEKSAAFPGAASRRSVKPLDFGKFLSEIFDEWVEKDIGSLKVQIFEEALRTAFSQEHTLCIFRPVCGGVPVVEMNGDFFSCDHYVTPEHRIGNIHDTTLAMLLDHPRQKAFGLSKKNTLPRYCLECEVLDMCNGECPKNRFITAPTGEPQLNYLCEGYRYFFNHCRPFASEVARIWSSGG